MSLSLQDRFAPTSICFGCGPANTHGLQVKSFPKADLVICEWMPKSFHEAFPGMLNGGIIGAILDCHSNWTSAYHLMQKNNLPAPPCTVTAEFTIKLLAPTPSQNSVTLQARVLESSLSKAKIEATLYSGSTLCATCHGVFVAVKPGHPAYHRW